MPDAHDCELTIVGAARLIYRTKSPSDDQIQRVYQRMKSGALPVCGYGSEPLAWTTTERALATFMAARMVQRRNPPRRPPGNPEPHVVEKGPGSPRRLQEANRFRSMYYGMWRDYFLAVMLRRRMTHRSATFRRAVVGGQVVALVTLGAMLGAVVRVSMKPVVPERVAIERWIDENTDRHQVVRWHPTKAAPDGGGVLVEVEYRYSKDSARLITTARTFCVVGDQATELPAR